MVLNQLLNDCFDTLRESVYQLQLNVDTNDMKTPKMGHVSVMALARFQIILQDGTIYVFQILSLTFYQ